MRDIRDLIEGLGRTPGILAGFVKSIPEERMHLRRGEGFWTIAEHVTHLARVQPMLLDRIRRFINEDHPEFVPHQPGDAGDGPGAAPCMDISTALEQFGHYRDKELVLLEGTDDTLWQKTATHPEYESYSLHILMRHMLMHDFWHMYRMEELWLARDAWLTKLE